MKVYVQNSCIATRTCITYIHIIYMYEPVDAHKNLIAGTTTIANKSCELTLT